MAPPQQFTRKELESRNTREDAAFVIDNVVYDVTKFLEDHPGGAEALLDNAGRDASRCFHDVGHSAEAHALREQFMIGEVVEADRWAVQARGGPAAAAGAEPVSLMGVLDACGPPLFLAFCAWWLYNYLF